MLVRSPSLSSASVAERAESEEALLLGGGVGTCRSRRVRLLFLSPRRRVLLLVPLRERVSATGLASWLVKGRGDASSLDSGDESA